MIDLSDYQCGGYMLIHPNKPDGDWLASFPQDLLSLSGCIVRRFEMFWVWAPFTPDNQTDLIAFGFAPEQFEALGRWGLQHSVDYPMVFDHPHLLRELAQQFVRPSSRVRLIGVGLHRDDREQFLQTAPLLQLLTVVLPEGGVEARIRRGDRLVEGGTPLGYEVVSYAYRNFGHSWLCSGLDQEGREQWGIHPNAHGLIPTYAQAKMLSDWIAEDNMQGHRGEPEPYAPWLLVEYPLVQIS